MLNTAYKSQLTGAARGRKTRQALGIALGIYLLLTATPLAYFYGAPLMTAADARPSDAIVLLSSGQIDADWLTPDAAQRVLAALRLYREGYARAIVSSGSQHGEGLRQAELQAAWLERAGVPSQAIVVENGSTRTYESGIAVKRIMAEHGWKSAVMVTSQMGNAQEDAGVLGLTQTTTLFGGSPVDGHVHGGVDVTLGMWLDCCNTWGIEGNYYDLGKETASYDSGLSNGNPILARPFFNTQLGAQDSELVAFPSLLAGKVSRVGVGRLPIGRVALPSQFVAATVVATMRCGCSCNSCCGSSYRLDVIGGYRYYNLSDDVTVNENLVTLTSPATTGTGINIIDSFRTRNSFNGVELGLISDYYCGRWSIEFSSKMSMGWNHEVVKINGGTIYTDPSGTLTGYSGGLLALDTNIGAYSQDVFLVIPEFGVQMSYQFTCHLRGFVGYDFLYWGQVARAGDQISLRVDPANIPPKIPGGGPDPAFNFNQASFWAQGVRLGGVAVLAGLSPAPRRQPAGNPSGEQQGERSRLGHRRLGSGRGPVRWPDRFA